MQFFTVSELWRQWDHLPERAVAITFDDGYADNLRHALPLLEKYDACATLYLVVDRHDRDWSTAKKKHHNTGELAREAKLSDEELRHMPGFASRIELGSHTLTHINMAATPVGKRRHELAESRSNWSRLSDQGAGTRALPIPSGCTGRRMWRWRARPGMTTAVTTIDGIDLRQPRPDPLQLQAHQDQWQGQCAGVHPAPARRQAGVEEMNAPVTVWLLSDGAPGHLSQSRGIVDALRDHPRGR
jgi:peptidoglycan/xylan/chitin deacetylase (PgdA/CDA1 family)